MTIVQTGITVGFGILAVVLLLWPANRERVKAYFQYRGFLFGGIWRFNRSRFGQASPWHKHIKTHRDSAMRLKILREFMEAWAKGDLDEIKHGYMTTNFEAYSGFVQGAVDCIGKECHRTHHYVYLVTGLALPVVQWFNYGRTPPQLFRDLKVRDDVRQNPISHFRYAMENWNGYTRFMTDFIKDRANKEDAPNVRMYRYILCFDDSVVAAAAAGNTGQPVELAKERSRENTMSQLKAWILCDAQKMPTPIALDRTADIIPSSSWKDGTDNPWLRFYRPWGRRKEMSHIIVPQDGALVLEDSGEPADPCKDYQWCMVKDVFSELYQDKPRHLFVSTLDLDAVTHHYDIDEDAIPQDFFLVGTKDEEIALADLFSAATTVDWAFCLSAVDADERLDKLELHFISSKGPRHPKVAPLGSIIEFLREEINAKKGSNQNRPVLGCEVARDL